MPYEAYMMCQKDFAGWPRGIQKVSADTFFHTLEDAQARHALLDEGLVCNSYGIYRVEIQLFPEELTTTTTTTKPKSWSDNHRQNLTVEDRDGNPISPTCAHCGCTEERCQGTTS